jgi:uncharacterized protein YgiM (DUF1202 family)
VKPSFAPARTLTAAVASGALLLGVAGALPAAADTQVTATEGVNIRSAPSTTAKIVGGLYRGQTVTAVTSAQGWTRVRFAGSSAYIASRYLTAGRTLPAAGRVSASSVKVTTSALNLRRGPGLSYAVVKVIANGTRVTLSGKSARGFAEVVVGASRGWVSAQYLASTSGLPAVVGLRTATANLNVRISSSATSKVVAVVKKGTRLSVTGASQNGRAQIIYRKAVRWVTAQYLANGSVSNPVAPALPRTKGSRYATTALLIRTSSDSKKFTVVAEVPKGTELGITGVRKNGRSQVIYGSAVRWVITKYLTTRRPLNLPKPTYGVEKGLSKNAIAVHRAAIEMWPTITTYYGYRNDPSSDHYKGNALDLMIPNYKTKSGKATGYKVADWAVTNQKRLKIQYVIWNQQIWNVSRAKEGWRSMADRGNDSANHKNHVHISVQ